MNYSTMSRSNTLTPQEQKEGEMTTLSGEFQKQSGYFQQVSSSGGLTSHNMTKDDRVPSTVGPLNATHYNSGIMNASNTTMSRPQGEHSSYLLNPNQSSVLMNYQSAAGAGFLNQSAVTHPSQRQMGEHQNARGGSYSPDRTTDYGGYV